jgi:Uncharacterized enzyme involved in inositol metabolism
MQTAKKQLRFPAAQLNVGWNAICNPDNSPLRWLHFGRLWLPEAQGSWTHETENHEETLVLLHGSGQIHIDNGPHYTLSLRRDPFVDPPTMVHIPAYTRYQVIAGPTGLDMAIAGAEAQPGGESLFFPASEVKATYHGAGRWKRKIHMGAVGDFPIQRLMVGETMNKPGGWTSFPPHKHDEQNPPQEMPYEEIYFFSMKPSSGFGIQRVYDPPQRDEALDETLTVYDGDTIAIPRGYHPVVGAPGVQMYYLWIMCGGEVGQRTYGQVSVDPNYAWLLPVEPLLED